MATFAQWVLHVLLPNTCLHCRRDLRPDDPGPLCPECRARLRPVDHPCALCGVPAEANLCPFCFDRPAPEPELIRAALIYGPEIASLVHAFKYRGKKRLAGPLGKFMADALEARPELSGFDALVPVPLHPRRLRERGFNQAELLALEVGRREKLSVIYALERQRSTPPQARLNDRASRWANIEGAFGLSPSHGKAEGRRLLLVDDVCTSGATLAACARLLKQAGAERVAALVLARQTLGPTF